MTRPARVGVVVMAYGTPASPEDIRAYYTHIRRGRPPTDEQLAELTARYEAIGGISPLAQRTRAQTARAIEVARRRGPGRYLVRLGQKHAAPFIEDAVAALADEGVERPSSGWCSPRTTPFSVGQYQDRAGRADRARLAFVGIDSWHLEPVLRRAPGGLGPRAPRRHAGDHEGRVHRPLPPRTGAGDDPYPDQLRESAEAIAESAGLPSGTAGALGWQSAGRTPEPWRGPDILEVIRELAAPGRAEGILVVPQGFTSDHLEVLYDLDIEAAAVAAEVGLAFARTEVVNDDPAVMAELAGRIAELAG
jgi:protoporphyrin/coproporphyrin ferrochelatase